MSQKKLKKIEATSLSEQLSAVDEEFKGFLASLIYKREFGPENLKTFSPLDAVANFEHQGIQAVREPTREEMMAHDTGFKKLLANMLNHCRPGALSDDDYNLISGINGREVHANG